MRKIREHIPCTRRAAQGNDTQLILMVKMETKHPVDGYFGSEFLAICNHCYLLRRPEVARPEI